MTIEISRATSPYSYRINPHNPRLVDRKLNKPRARWEAFRLCASEEIARVALLALERKEGNGE